MVKKYYGGIRVKGLRELIKKHECRVCIICYGSRLLYMCRVPIRSIWNVLHRFSVLFFLESIHFRQFCTREKVERK